jgi:hypothetical protein
MLATEHNLFFCDATLFPKQPQKDLQCGKLLDPADIPLL